MNGNDTFLDINNAHLRVNSGNVQASTFVIDQINIVTSANTASTVNFNNLTKAFNAASNIEVGTANLFVDTTTSNVGIGTDAPAYTLDVHGTANVEILQTTSNIVMNGGTFSLGGHMIPTAHEQYDIGTAEKKIRHLFLSDNSLWLGDETNITFSGGKMKFRRRKKNVLPRGLVNIGVAAGHANETATLNAALAYANKPIADMKLEHWLGYAKTLDPTKDISDVFTQDATGYEAITASEAFKEIGDDIFSLHNVAIGKSTAPTSALDVVGTVKATAFEGDGSALTGITAGQWTESSGNIYRSSGRVGIGTTSPRALLDVSGPTGIPAILTSGANDSEGDIAVPTDQAVQIGHWDNGTSTFTNRFYISSSGNIGIGTTSPEQKLEVHGNILLGQNQVKSYIHGGNSMAVSSDADVLIVADSNDTSGAVGSNSIIFGAGSAIDTDNRNFTYAQAYPNDVPRVELMRLTAEAIEGEPGRLGVGTTSPEHKLHLHANHEYLYQRFSTTANSTTDKFDIACWNSTRSNGDHGVMFNNRANTDTRFINNGAEVMRLKNDGKVGIGRNDPQEKLHVVGNIAVNWSNDRRIIMNHDNSYRQGIEMDAGTRTMTLFSTGGGNDGGALLFKTREAAGSSDSDYGTQRMRINKNGSIVIGDIGGYATGGYTDAQLTIGGTHNQSSGYNTSNQIKLLITGGNNDTSSPYYVLCEDENARVQFFVKGATTDNSGNGKVYMRGWLRVQGYGGSISGATYHAGFIESHTSLQRWTGNHSNVGIYADDDIMTNGYILSINGTFSASDRRIKKDITDIDDGAALQSLRQLQPKKYKYKDTYNKPDDTVWGFIAQDVRETIPNSTQLRTECIPNINEVATVSGTNVITFTGFDTSNLEIGTIIRVHDDGNAAHEIKVTAIIDARSVQVEEDVSKWARSFNEDGTMGEGDGLYVYGQQVDDFVFIKKDAIWTVAVAAVQEIDRQLQAEKTKVATLETQLASVLARLDALENA